MKPCRLDFPEYSTVVGVKYQTTDYKVRGLASGCWCAFFTFAFLSVLFVDPLGSESTLTFDRYSN